MADIPIVVAFGPSEDSFYIGAGRRFYIQNMPQSLTEKVRGTELPIGRVNWINVDNTGEQWCGENFLSQTTHYSVNAGSDLHQHLQSAGSPEFVSFCENPGSYFIKHKARGTWNANLENSHLRTLKHVKENIQNFDLGLKWIIFGSNGSHIYQFESGFLLAMEGKHEDPEHPFRKAVKEFDEDTERTWIIDRGSSMCLYDDRYYMLKIKESNSNSFKLRYNLPPAMDEKLKELVELARTPEEQQALFADQQNMMAQINARANMQMQMLQLQSQMNSNLCNTIRQAGVSFANAASSGTQWELVDKRW